MRMRFEWRSPGAWLLAMATLGGCSPLSQLPAPPRGPMPQPVPVQPAPQAEPAAAPHVEAPAAAMPTPEPVVQEPPAEAFPDDYQVMEPKEPKKKRSKRDKEDEKDDWDFFFDEMNGEAE
jgi:hypothetical protein